MNVLDELKKVEATLEPLEHDMACAWLAVRRAQEHIKRLNSRLDVAPEHRLVAKLIERMMKPNEPLRSHCEEALYVQQQEPIDSFMIYQAGVRYFADENGIVPWNDWTIDDDGGLTWRPKREE